MRRPAILLVLLSLLLLGGATRAADPAAAEPDRDDMRLLRMPDIHGDTIVFVYAGDLWTVPAAGGEARRLTSHVGEETFPKFSPDGRHIAFSGDYDGNRDVFVIPAAGGVPERLTWHPAPDRVIDWQPDGRSVRFQSLRAKHDGNDLQLWTVPLAGGLPQKMILPEGGLSSYSPDGRRLAYNRRTREFRTWKRYKGGWAQDIWIFDFASNQGERVTDWVGTDSFPMWYGDTIYFTSDRTGRLQIWARDLATGEQRQVTRHEEYDVKFPSLGPDAIVYENGGWLWVLDLPGEQTRRVKVSLHDDFVLTRSALKTVDDLISSADIAPDAKRAVFAARGDVFSVPAEKGNVRNLTASSGVRERAPAWSPDGRWIAYFGDRSGEYEIYLRSGDGRGEERCVTKGIRSYLTGMRWSPDSRKILFSAADLTLSCLEVAGGKISRIAKSPVEDITDYAWSPDSRWVAYAMAEENGYASIFLYDTETEQTTRVTTNFTNDTDPVFDPEGKYLYFASARNWQPVYGNIEFRPLWTQQDGIYLVMLGKDQAIPFPPESDEVEVQEEGKKEKKQDEDKDARAGKKDKDEEAGEEAEPPPETKIDLAGIEQRIVALPVEAGNYRNLQAAEGKLFYQSRPLRPGSKTGPALLVFVMEDREAKTVLAEANFYRLAANGEKILYASHDSYGIVDAAPDQKPAEKPLRTGEMKAHVDPRAEWVQMMREAWRVERDFFYDPGLHGVDWDHMYERYAQLVPYIAHRSDLDYLIGEMLGELNCSHSYIRHGGDFPRPERLGTGLLGCDFVLDERSGRYRLENVLRERDWNGDDRTPLNVPGQEVPDGAYLLAVDGVDLRAPLNPYALFEDKADRAVVLSVASRADGKDGREITVEPIRSEAGLRYTAWAAGNRRKVAELSGGRIGYLHMPNTAVHGAQEFAKGYYPQLRKEALIIDERYNGGGWVPDFFMNILRQKLVSLWQPRYGQLERTPGSTFAGHLAMISNGLAGSGGDALPYYFKAYGLGPLVGTRTWGGLVGYSRVIRLLDGGGVTIPEFAFINTQGRWDVEGHGVDPDVEIDNLPQDVIAGRDPQLEKAVAVLLQKLKEEPVELPEAPDFPRDKAR